MEAVQDDLLTVIDVAERLHVRTDAVRRWIREGQLRGIAFGNRTGYRIRASEVEKFLLRRQTKMDGIASQQEESGNE